MDSIVALWLIGAVLAFGVLARLDLQWVEMAPQYSLAHAYRTVTVRDPWVVGAVDTAALAAEAGVLLVGVAGLLRRRWGWVGLAGLMGLGWFPLLLLGTAWDRCGAWTFHDEVIGPEGRAYVFMDSSCLQGQTLLLARPLTHTATTRTYEAVGNTNGDSPRSWIPVVRPAGAEDRYGQLCVAPSGWLVGIRGRNQVYFAYDPAADRFLGHGPIEELSSFVLLGPDTPLHGPDVERLEAAVREGFPRREGMLRESTLREGLRHSNPEVRTLARRLLELGGAQGEE